LQIILKKTWHIRKLAEEKKRKRGGEKKEELGKNFPDTGKRTG
jgi:hypothetical protein